MKQFIFITLFVLSSATYALNCADYLASSPREYSLYEWGQSVDVAYQNTITFAYDLKEYERVSGITVDYESYGGFECYTRDIDVVGQCLLVRVDWSPGTDFSGCKLYLSHNQHYIGRSEMYMRY